MTKVLVIVMFICLIFSVLSIMVTPGNDDDAEAARLAVEETDDDDDGETDDDDDGETDDEEPVVSSLSFSTSAALSSDDYIAPDISGGRIPVDCVEGSWGDVGVDCNQSTGKIQQRKYITPARNGGTCGVEPDPENYIYQDRDCEEYCTLDANWSPACPTRCDLGASSITQTKGQTSKKYVNENGKPCYGESDAKRKRQTSCPATAICPATQKKLDDARRAKAKAEADAAVAEARTGSCQGQVRYDAADNAENARICAGLRKSKCTSALFPPNQGLPYHWYCMWVEH